MKPGRGVRRGLVVALACALLSASAAVAATVTVGQLFTPTDLFCGGTFLQTGVASGKPYTVPKAGVITSWSFDEGTETVSGLKLKVGRSAGGGMYTIVGEAAAGTQVPNKVNSYTTSIPVKAGDLIGIHSNGTGGSDLCGKSTTSKLDKAVFAPGDQAPGTTTSYSKDNQVKYPISVHVSVDCIVPKLKGKTLRQAKHALTQASCRLGKVTKKESSGKPGIVLSQKPNSGKQLSPASKVAVVVSSN